MNTENNIDLIEDETEMKRSFPGWSPDLGTSRYGYPWPPNMSIMTDSHVRQWAKHAIDLRAVVDIDCVDGQVDHAWVVDANRWIIAVIEAVSRRLGPDDAATRAYADDVFTRASAEIELIRNSIQTNGTVDWAVERF